MKLTIELVPKTSFYSNVRSMLPKSTWFKIRKETIFNANNVCEICGGTTSYRGLDCHEVWEYDDINHIQKLIKFIALCNRCHEVKHIGKAQIDGHFNRAEEWFRTINNITNPFEVQYRIAQAFDLWAERSQHQWQIDMTVLKIGDETNGK